MNKKTYLVWKNPNCNGINPEWVSMNGKEFFQFIKKAENKKRYFMCLDNRVCEDADIITMECTLEIYKEWRIQQNHERYLDRFKEGRILESMSSYIDETQDITFEEIVADETVDIEDDLIRVVKNQLLKNLFEGLTNKEKELIHFLYIENDGLSEREICRRFNIPQKTLNCRKIKVKEKLKKFLAQNGF